MNRPDFARIHVEQVGTGLSRCDMATSTCKMWVCCCESGWEVDEECGALADSVRLLLGDMLRSICTVEAAVKNNLRSRCWGGLRYIIDRTLLPGNKQSLTAVLVGSSEYHKADRVRNTRWFVFGNRPRRPKKLHSFRTWMSHIQLFILEVNLDSGQTAACCPRQPQQWRRASAFFRADEQDTGRRKALNGLFVIDNTHDCHNVTRCDPQFSLTVEVAESWPPSCSAFEVHPYMREWQKKLPTLAEMTTT